MSRNFSAKLELSCQRKLAAATVAFIIVYRLVDENALLKTNFHIYVSTKTNVVGTQKNRLNEMVLLSTQNIC